MARQYKIVQATFHITYVCTHHCPMCYANAKKDFLHPPISQLYKVVDQLELAGIHQVSLVGGDPALYPQIVELVQYMHKKNMKISILSNTLEFNGYKEKVLNEIDTFEGTIHHSISERHDEFCNFKGAYETLVNNLKYFSDQNKKVGIAINLIPYNYNVIYNLVNNIVNYGVNINHVVMQRIIPFGRAKNSSCYEIPDNDMLAEALNQIEKVETELGIKIIFEDPIPLCAISEKYKKYMHPCDWGITKLSVDYNGNLSRCGADIYHSFGSIFEKNINDIWNKNESLELFRNKKYLPDRCFQCEKFRYCAGGCPISRHPEKGYSIDYLAMDK